MAGSKTLKVIIAGDAKGALAAMGDIESKSGGLAGKFGMLGTAAGLGFAAVGAAAVGAGVALYKIGSNFAQATDAIRVGTGQTGASLEGLKESFKRVIQDVPASFSDASLALSQLNQRLGLTGPALETLTAQFLNLSRITKTDLAANVAAMTRVFGDWSIVDQSKALDEMFRASQATGAGLTELTERVVQFGAPLRGLGFGFEESLALVGKWEKEGVNFENVMGAMKKAYGEFAKEFGGKAPEEFRKWLDELRRAPTAAEAATMAIKKLGVRNGPDFAAAAREGRFAFGDLVNTIANGSDTISKAAEDTEHFGEKWTKFTNRLQVALEPLASGLFDVFGNVMDRLSPVFSEVTGGFTALVGAFKEGDGDVTSSGFPGFMEQVGFKAREAYDGIRSFVDGLEGSGGLSGAISRLYERNAGFHDSIDNVKKALSSFWNDVLVPVGNWIRDEFTSNILPKLQSSLRWFAETGWPAISKAAQWFYETVLKPMLEYIGQNQEQFKNIGVALLVVVGVITAAAAVILVFNAALIAVAAVILGTVIVAIVALVAWISNLAQSVWDVFNNVRDALGGALDFLENGVQFLSDLIQNLGSGLVKLPGIIGSALAAAASAVAGFVSTVAGAVAGFATRLPGLIAGWATAFWSWLEMVQTELPGRLAYLAGWLIGWVTGTGVRLQENINTWVGAALTWVVTVATEIPGRLLSVTNAIWQWVFATAAALPGQVTSITSAMWEWVAGVAAALPGQLAQWGSQMLAWSFGLAGSIAGWLGATASAIGGWIWGVASGLPGQLWGWSTQFANWAGNLAGSIGGWLGNVTSAIWNWITGIPGIMAGALGGMVNIGRGIVEGIWQGIQNMWGWLRDKVSSFATGIVDGFKSALHIGSPAKALYPVGEAVTQGVGVGMMNEAPSLQRTAAALMGGISYPVTAPSIRASGLAAFTPGAPMSAQAASAGLVVPAASGTPGTAAQPIVVQLVVDRRVLAEVMADGSRQRGGTLR